MSSITTTDAQTSTSDKAAKRPWAIKSLPPFPAVALQLVSVLDDDDAPMKTIVNLLRSDPALSAEILRVSNSALYGLSRRVDNVPHAVVVLGTDVVKRLALTVALGRFSQSFLRNQGLRRCWDHSVAGALIAERLAGLLDQPKDRAYTAGLLHDIGRLALLACYPNEYGNLFEVARENNFDELECERQLFDIDHCAVGEWLGQHWNLPVDIVAGIAHHHTHTPNDASLLSIVTASNAIADALGFAAIQLQNPKPIEEILAPLPVCDMAQALERFSSYEEEIRSAINAITPS